MVAINMLIEAMVAKESLRLSTSSLNLEKKLSLEYVISSHMQVVIEKKVIWRFKKSRYFKTCVLKQDFLEKRETKVILSHQICFFNLRGR